ncbi:MAG: YceI family protein [Phycisphaerae bacterium]|jgi:polyisoprenoid-binding protein YceI|nr:YceI family protein [Phycisphaerae bacterium]
MRLSVFALRLIALTAILTTSALPQVFATGLDVNASGPKTFYVNPRAGNSQVTVFSRSTLEDFTTVCNRVSGEWQVDPKNLETFRGRFSLRVEDMHTGIELRDRDMRGAEWFDAARYPEVVIEISRAENVRPASANSASMNLVGTCTMHGQTNPVSIPATLAYMVESPQTMKLVKGDVIRIRAEFTVKLSDYGITGPRGSEIIGVKVSDEQEVKVTIFGATEKPPEELAVDTQPAAGGGAVPPPPPPPPPPPN